MKKFLKIIAQLIISLFAVSILSASASWPNYGSAILIGTDGGNGNTNPISTSNPIPIAIINIVSTYRASIADLSPAASATDVTTLCGSATKTVKVRYIQASADTTAPASMDFYVYLRTASDVGGTSAPVAAASLDPTNNPTSTAAVRSYTANPSSLGTGILIVGDHYAAPAATSTGYPITQWMETFGTRGTQPIILRGVNQCAAFGFNGNAIPAGASVYVNWEFTEE